MSLLAGKSIVVTGGNSGIGEAIALACAAAGANVVINWVADPEATDALIARIEAAGGTAVGLEADVADPATPALLVATAVERFGRLDVLVNNAGIQTHTSLLETTQEDYDRVMAVDMRGPFFAAQAAARQFIAQGGPGVIINISSVHEESVYPGNLPYCVAKGGLRMFTRTAALELAALGIRVLNVGPGAIDTPINDEWRHDPAEVARVSQLIPARRVGTPTEVGDVVAFLASDKASYMTGSTVMVDGGSVLGTG